MSTKEKKVFIILTESRLDSWIRDASTFAMFVGLIGIGVYLESAALQWVGAACGFISIIARASGVGKKMSREEAIKFLHEEAA